MKGRIRIAIACTGLLLAAPLGARAQTAFRETGSITVGGYLVWVRGTNAKVVELFVGRGFRDAFAKAHDMDAVRLQQWIDSVRAVQPVPADDSSSADAQLRGTSLGADVTMMRRVGGSYSGLRVLVNGEDPIKMAEPTARDFIAMLDSAARVTRELSVPPPSIMASMPIRDAAPQVEAAAAPDAPDAPTTMATPAPKPEHAPTRAPMPAPAPPPPPPAPPPIAPTSSPAPAAATALASTMGASTAEAPPELVLQGPSAKVSSVGEAPALSALPTPVIALPARVAAVAQVPAPETEVETPTVSAPAAPVSTAPTPPVAAAAATPASDSAAPPHVDVPADKLIRTPLGPFTIPAALLSDRDKEAQYCYTQLGLKYNPELKGEITVKLSLRTDGGVDEAVVTKRSWQGISAGEVEACVRALAHDWSFASNDPSVTDGAKILTFRFTP
jgi:hypothetical protein